MIAVVSWPLIANAQTLTFAVFRQFQTPYYGLAVADKVEEVPEPLTIEQKILATFPDAPIMVEVARAESQFVPTAKNPKSSATGIFQILLSTWDGAKCKGERTNEDDNIACARKVYDNSVRAGYEGLRPWYPSKSKWGKLIDSSLTIVNNR